MVGAANYRGLANLGTLIPPAPGCLPSICPAGAFGPKGQVIFSVPAFGPPLGAAPGTKAVLVGRGCPATGPRLGRLCAVGGMSGHASGSDPRLEPGPDR